MYRHCCRLFLRTPRVHLAIIVHLLVGCLSPLASAAITWSGDVDPADPNGWTNSTTGYIGNTAVGTIVVDGASSLLSQEGWIAAEAGSTGEATITGSGSQWNSELAVFVGYGGSGSLLVEAGGSVSTAFGVFGVAPGSSGIVTISGTDSEFDASEHLYIGVEGNGELVIETGGHVSNFETYLGDKPGSAGAAVVTGTDAYWNNDYLVVGNEGNGTLLVEATGQVSSRDSAIGNTSASSGEVTVRGVGSLWDLRSSLSVGVEGSGELIIENGGQVSNRNSSIGLRANANGIVTVDGTGSQWMTGTLAVGSSGGGALMLQSGGQVSSFSGNIGYRSGSTGTVTVTGTGSHWIVGDGDIYVGREGSGLLTITDGGLFSIGGHLSIDDSMIGDSSINMSYGGMLALQVEADDSLAQFLDFISGTDAMRYWDVTLSDWVPLTNATRGVDYTLEYLTTGDLSGYTLLTVVTPPSTLTGDYNDDGVVDLADYTVWRDNLGSSIMLPNDSTPGVTADDYLVWRSNFGQSASTSTVLTSVPEPATMVLLASGIALGALRHRQRTFVNARKSMVIDRGSSGVDVLVALVR